jgi:hypothetical protein
MSRAIGPTIQLLLRRTLVLFVRSSTYLRVKGEIENEGR